MRIFPDASRSQRGSAQRPFKRLLTALQVAVSVLAFGQSASAQVTVTTDWGANQGPVKPNLLGLNLWSGMDPATASSTAYKNSLSAISPGFARYHAAEQLGTTGKGWLDSNGNWVASRINTVLDNTQGYSQTRIVTITRWPDKYRASGSDRLDPARVTDYANWCASLVGIMKDNNHGVTYYEPFNEVENLYSNDINTLADTFVAARAAMKQRDPNCKVGAPVFTNPWNYTQISDFLNRVGNNIDFFSYHHYASGDSNASESDLYDATLWGGGIANRAVEIKQDLRNRGLNIPLFITEHNLFYNYQQDLSRRLMKTSRSAVFDALLLKGLAEAGDIDGSNSWNDGDYTFGKLADGPNYGMRPSAYFMKLGRENLLGEIASTRTSADKTVQGFAVFNGTKHTLCLINRTQSTQTVNTSFAGNWSPSSTSYVQHELSDIGTDGNSVGGYTSSNKTWSGAPQNISMPANSVFLLVFNSSSRSGGNKPYGGSARAIPGRIQAEDYDTGGQGNAYLDTNFGNTGGQYRNDRVDITTTADAGGGYAVTDTATGEWLQYTTNLAAGTYNIKLRASSTWGTNNNAITVKLNGTTLGSTGVSTTWNDDSYTDINISNVVINSNQAGNGKTLRLEFAQGGFRLNWIEFTSTGATVTPYVGQTISLLAAVNGKYVCADNYGNDPLIANRTAVGDWEKFLVVDAGGGYVALKSNANGKYVTADLNNSTQLRAAATSIGAWEKYQIVDAGSSKALKANANGNYVCADNYGNNPLAANKTAVGQWESFTITTY